MPRFSSENPEARPGLAEDVESRLDEEYLMYSEEPLPRQSGAGKDEGVVAEKIGVCAEYGVFLDML